MTQTGELIARMAARIRTGWRALFVTLAPYLAAFVALQLAQWFVQAKRDLFLKLTPDQFWAPFVDPALTRVFLALEIMLLGLAVARLWRREPGAGPAFDAARFFRRWGLIAAATAAALILIDGFRLYYLFLRAAPPGPVEAKFVSLMGIYVELLIAYGAVRLLTAAPAGEGWGLSAGRSLAPFAVFVLIYLTIGNVLLAILIHTPPISLIWFLLDELSPLRFITGEAARIGADTLGFALYALFVVTACTMLKGDETTAPPART